MKIDTLNDCAGIDSDESNQNESSPICVDAHSLIMANNLDDFLSIGGTRIDPWWGRMNNAYWRLSWQHAIRSVYLASYKYIEVFSRITQFNMVTHHTFYLFFHMHLLSKTNIQFDKILY